MCLRLGNELERFAYVSAPAAISKRTRKVFTVHYNLPVNSGDLRLYAPVMKASEVRLVFNLNLAATENLNVKVARSTKTASFYEYKLC